MKTFYDDNGRHIPKNWNKFGKETLDILRELHDKWIAKGYNPGEIAKEVNRLNYLVRYELPWRIEHKDIYDRKS